MKKIISILSVSITLSILGISCSDISNTPKNDGHEHTYSENWTFDEKFHWKNANCSGSWDCKKRIAHKDFHSFSNWTIDEETFKSTGEIIEKNFCSVCEYSISRESEFPHFKAVDSEGQGIKIKFFLPENVREITFLKNEADKNNLLYYSRIRTNGNDKLTEKELIWSDPYVEDGKEYKYLIRFVIENDGNYIYSYDNEQNSYITIKSKGGLGEFKITNTPSGSFNPETNTFTIDVKPEFSISNAQTYLLLNTQGNQCWFNLTTKQITITAETLERVFGTKSSQFLFNSFAVTGNISSAWPYSGQGELFYRSNEGGFLLSKEPFTIKK